MGVPPALLGPKCPTWMLLEDKSSLWGERDACGALGSQICWIRGPRGPEGKKIPKNNKKKSPNVLKITPGGGEVLMGVPEVLPLGGIIEGNIGGK